MAAWRRSQVGGGSGFAAVFMLLLVLGLVIEFFWWILGAAALGPVSAVVGALPSSVGTIGLR